MARCKDLCFKYLNWRLIQNAGKEQYSSIKRVSNYSVLVNSVKINRENANYFWVKGKPELARNGGL